MTKFSAIAFVGKNTNGILTWLTTALAERAKVFDISMTIIDFDDQDWIAKMNECLSKTKPLFAFGYQGFGTNFPVESGNLWNAMKVPFITLMGDAPFYAPKLHAVVGASFFHLYSSEDFQNVYHEFLQGKNFSCINKGFYPPNPYADEIPWADREFELVYVKTGVDAQAIRRTWNRFPAKIRDVAEEAARTALTGQPDTIAKLVARCFAANNIYFGTRHTLFLSICSGVDSYVRAVRAERMLREVMRHGGHIFGDWPHIDKSETKATFHAPISAAELNRLYARSRILVNIAPCTLNYAHERIVAAFLAKAFSLSDATPALKETLSVYPSFKSVSIDSVDVSDQFNTQLAEIRRLASSNDPETPGMLEEAKRRTEDEYGVDRFIAEILQMVTIHRLEEECSEWAW